MFDAILSNGSITAASEALGISQSSVSKQLKNLRHYFADELFVRSGQGMAATSKALVQYPVEPQRLAMVALFRVLGFTAVELEKVDSQQQSLDGVDVQFWREGGLFFALAQRS